MPNESFVIEVNGEEATDLYEDLVSLEVELCHEMPATFQLNLALYRQPESGQWLHLDDERLRVWNQVTIRAGFVGGGHEELVRGYVTRVTPRFTADEEQSVLEIAGMDGSMLMDREEKLKDWPNKKDSDIAREILDSYGFTAEVENTEVDHDEALSTVIQRETDLQFLQRLAKRNGFHCYVEGTTGYFRRVPSDNQTQPVLAVHFGEATNLVNFTATVDALRPTNIAMYQVDRFNKEVLVAEVEAGTREVLGRLDAAALLRGSVEAGQIYVAKNAATGTPEMTALCQGLFRAGSWFVEGEGEINAAAYAHVLRPRALVTIKGVGETYSGVYYVCLVRHVLTRDSYTEYFRVKRDALLPTGDEDFSSNGDFGLL
ncbi:MAG: phage late control D family protein [Gemmatimonadales bacterium]|nr:phage late control D family protein [Gemmatimonadales bacterium]